MKCVAVLAPADKVSAKDNITKVFLMMSFSKIEKKEGQNIYVYYAPPSLVRFCFG